MVFSLPSEMSNMCGSWLGLEESLISAYSIRDRLMVWSWVDN
jgi:hypothetical protein